MSGVSEDASSVDGGAPRKRALSHSKQSPAKRASRKKSTNEELDQ
jgi:hypothetical protein